MLSMRPRVALALLLRAPKAQQHRGVGELQIVPRIFRPGLAEYIAELPKIEVLRLLVIAIFTGEKRADVARST